MNVNVIKFLLLDLTILLNLILTQYLLLYLMKLGSNYSFWITMFTNNRMFIPLLYNTYSFQVFVVTKISIFKTRYTLVKFWIFGKLKVLIYVEQWFPVVISHLSITKIPSPLWPIILIRRNEVVFGLIGGTENFDTVSTGLNWNLPL